jgi:hypothetical protein
MVIEEHMYIFIIENLLDRCRINKHLFMNCNILKLNQSCYGINFRLNRFDYCSTKRKKLAKDRPVELPRSSPRAVAVGSPGRRDGRGLQGTGGRVSGTGARARRAAAELLRSGRARRTCRGEEGDRRRREREEGRGGSGGREKSPRRRRLLRDGGGGQPAGVVSDFRAFSLAVSASWGKWGGRRLGLYTSGSSVPVHAINRDR